MHAIQIVTDNQSELHLKSVGMCVMLAFIKHELALPPNEQGVSIAFSPTPEYRIAVHITCNAHTLGRYLITQAPSMPATECQKHVYDCFHTPASFCLIPSQIYWLFIFLRQGLSLHRPDTGIKGGQPSRLTPKDLFTLFISCYVYGCLLPCVPVYHVLV